MEIVPLKMPTSTEGTPIVTFDTFDFLNRIESVIWTENFFTLDDVEIKAPWDPFVWRKFSLGSHWMNTESKRVMRVMTRIVADDENGRRMITIRGSGAEVIFKYRAMYGKPSGSSDYSLIVSAYPSQAVYFVLNKVVDGTAPTAGQAAEALPASRVVVLGTPPSESAPELWARSVEDVYTWAQAKMKPYYLGLQARYNEDEQKIDFEIYCPVGRTENVIFREDIDELKNISWLESDEGFARTTYAYGKWQTGTVGPYTQPGATPTSYWQNLSSQAPEVTDTDPGTGAGRDNLVKSKARDYLSQHKAARVIDCELGVTSLTGYGFGYFLGDIIGIQTSVTGKDPKPMRLTQFVRSIGPSGPSHYLTLADPEAGAP